MVYDAFKRYCTSTKNAVMATYSKQFNAGFNEASRAVCKVGGSVVEGRIIKRNLSEFTKVIRNSMKNSGVDAEKVNSLCRVFGNWIKANF